MNGDNDMIYDVDLESKITDAWSISNDLILILQAFSDYQKDKSVIICMLDGVIALNDMKFTLLLSDYEKIKKELEENGIEYDNQFQSLYENCYQIINDTKIVSKNFKENILTDDEFANVLIGLQTLSDMKFNELFNEFSKILKMNF